MLPAAGGGLPSPLGPVQLGDRGLSADPETLPAVHGGLLLPHPAPAPCPHGCSYIRTLSTATAADVGCVLPGTAPARAVPRSAPSPGALAESMLPAAAMLAPGSYLGVAVASLTRLSPAGSGHPQSHEWASTGCVIQALTAAWMRQGGGLFEPLTGVFRGRCAAWRVRLGPTEFGQGPPGFRNVGIL